MSTSARTAVIVLNYFGAERTEVCLRSLVGQDFDTLLLGDNSADDAERDRLHEVVQRVSSLAPTFRIQLLFNGENLGYARGINSAIRSDRAESGGHDRYLLLNNDTRLSPGAIAALNDAMSRDSRRALVAPRILWGRETVRYRGYVAALGHVSRRTGRPARPYLTGCCLLVDAAMVGEGDRLFDEDFFMYGEDIWLSWRARELGRTIHCEETSSILHEGSATALIGGRFYEYHVTRGHVLLAEKLAHSRGTLLMYRAGRLAYLGCRALVRSVRFRSLVPAEALVEAWRLKHQTRSARDP